MAFSTFYELRVPELKVDIAIPSTFKEWRMKKTHENYKLSILAVSSFILSFIPIIRIKIMKIDF